MSGLTPLKRKSPTQGSSRWTTLVLGLVLLGIAAVIFISSGIDVEGFYGHLASYIIGAIAIGLIIVGLILAMLPSEKDRENQPPDELFEDEP